jgi:hypothetical protein
VKPDRLDYALAVLLTVILLVGAAVLGAQLVLHLAGSLL